MLSLNFLICFEKLKDRDLVYFFEDRTKLKTPSEIAPLKLVNHVSTAHPESSNLICEDCGLFFRSKLTVEFHQKMTHKSQLTHEEKDKKLWTCPICTNKFPGTNGRGILFHLKSCESKLEKMIKGCLKCGRVFDVKILTPATYEAFRDHINKCGQLILCEICGESFKGKVGTLFLLV